MNTAKNKKIDLGKDIADQRQAKGWSVQQLSDITKISVTNIENIEKGVLDFLPSAYVKAYLSSISRELGLDPDVILKKYQESFFRNVSGTGPDVKPAPEPESIPTNLVTKTEPVKSGPEVKEPVKEEKPEPEPKSKPEPAPGIKEEPAAKPEEPSSGTKAVQDAKPESKDKAESKPEPAMPSAKKPDSPKNETEPKPEFKPEPQPQAMSEEPITPITSQGLPPSNWFEDLKLMLGFYSVFIYAFIFVAILVAVFVFVIPKLSGPKQSDELQFVKAAPDTNMTSTGADSLSSMEPPPLLPMSLKLEVTDSTWMRIVFNGGFTEEAIFAPGDEKIWQSDSLFWLRIGNASGIKLYLDDQDLGPVGGSGQITNIKINRDGVQSVRKTEFPPEMGIEGS